MGLRDRLAKALLPPGTVTMSEQQVAALAPQSGARAEPLDRDPNLASLPFPPSMPLIPALINERRDDGRADPRKWEYPVAWNLQLIEQRNIPFRVLREIADQADIVRKCIEVVKGAIAGQEWDISVSDDAIAHLVRENNIGNLEAARLIRDHYTQDIARIKDFWKMPDRINGMGFHEWVSSMLEEVLVIDALSIYPNRSLDNKQLASLEILDGATIKPLLDARGNRPLPPHAAYQQILWGFPRGEFTAGSDVDGEFSADDLVYMPKTRRPFTPYGFSPVERCLSLVDLYMKRLHWYRTEFTDGVMPDLFIKSDMEYGTNPQLLKAYEQIFNDEMAGNLEQRRRMRLLPSGFEPIMPRVAETKYTSVFDEFIVKSITGHFGVLPSQIGFTPQSGLGGAGHQEGEANSAETLGLRPMITWVTGVLNYLSQRFLNMPDDLTFTFTDGTETDHHQMAQRRQIELFSGQKTWNEIRSEMGYPLYEFTEADAPILVQGRTVIPLAATFDSVSINADEQEDAIRPPDEELFPEGVPNDSAGIRGANGSAERPPNTPPSPVKAELGVFAKWAKKNRGRDFEFVHLEPSKAAHLNALVREDADAARELAQIWAGDVCPKVLTLT